MTNIRNWIADKQGRVRVGEGRAVGRGERDLKVFTQVYDLDSKRWVELWEYTLFEEPSITALGFGSDPNILYFRADHDGNYAIFKMDITSVEKNWELVFADQGRDVMGGLIFSPKTGDVIGAYHGDEDGWTYWEDGYNKLQAMIDRALPDRINRMDHFSRDEKVIVVSSRKWSEPTEYYLLDRNKGGLEFISSQYPLLEGQEVSGKRQVSYTARDGLKISAYVTKAHGNTEAAPAIVFPHGGPMARTWEDFSWWAEFLASRGYTVIQPNFRGSTGYGFEFTQEAVKNWGGTMQDDLEDAARFLVDEYNVDASKICIIGASYGGFAATYAAAHQTETFRCAVSFAGVTDLVGLRTLLNKSTLKNVFKAMVGSSNAELNKMSPMTYVDQVEIPVLLLHGTHDSVVPVDQSQRYAKKLERSNKHVRYIEFENETHFLEKASTREILLSEIEIFLENALAEKTIDEQK